MAVAASRVLKNRSRICCSVTVSTLSKRRICEPPALNGRFAAIPVANAYRLGDIVDEDFAVADLAGTRRVRDALDDFLQPGVLNHEFELHFRKKVHVVFLAAVNLFVALLAPVTANLADRHSVD